MRRDPIWVQNAVYTLAAIIILSFGAFGFFILALDFAAEGSLPRDQQTWYYKMAHPPRPPVAAYSRLERPVKFPPR